jgi:hypothetical protein
MLVDFHYIKEIEHNNFILLCRELTYEEFEAD